MRVDDMLAIDGKALVLKGRFLKVAQLRDELYVPVEDPIRFVEQLRSSNAKADLFTFCQEIHDRVPKYDFHQEWHSLGVLPMTTYDNWLKCQIDGKTRNMVRKAQKSGVDTRLVPFSDALVEDIKNLYEADPVRQGRTFWHYGKDFAQIKREHATFVDRSDFIGAYCEDKLIGFAKVTHSANYSILMNFVSMISHRNKAPSNGLLAKAIEICTQKQIPLLVYGMWGKRPGLRTFKLANGFQCFQIPRYFVPLNVKGRLALKLNLHRGLIYHMPERWVIMAGDLRSRFNAFRWRKHRPVPGT